MQETSKAIPSRKGSAGMAPKEQVAPLRISGLQHPARHCSSIVDNTRTSILRLRYPPNTLFGRFSEQQSLLGKFEEVANDDSRIVFVEGDEGVGKTSLVESMKGLVGNSRFVCGRFEQQCTHLTGGVGSSSRQNKNNNTRPYSAVLTALGELCDSILSSRDDYFAIGDVIASSLEDDMPTLLKLVPNLRNMLSTKQQTNLSSIIMDNSSSAEAIRRKRSYTFERFQFILRDFLLIVCKRLRSVFMFIDNLQYSDEYTLKFIKLIQQHTWELHGLLIVGAYRPQPPDSPFSFFVNKMKQEANFTKMVLPASSSESVNEMLSKAMETSPERTNEITAVVMKKTGGNMFAVKTFLQIAQDSGMLAYCPKSYQWAWNLQDLEAKTAISDNLVQVVLERMRTLPPLHQTALSIAATLGTHFDVSIITKVLAKMGSNTATRNESTHCLQLWSAQTHADVERLFETLKNTGFIEKGPDGWSKFAASRIQLAAFKLIKGRREKLHLRIGEALLSSKEQHYYQKQPQKADWIFHACVDQFNLGSKLLNQTGRLNLAQMNLEAAQNAKSHSAFLPASEYAEKGLGMLMLLDGSSSTNNNMSPWLTHYDLALALTTLAAEMHQFLGDSDKCLNRVKDILTNAKCLEDKLGAHYIQLDVLGSTRRLEESIMVGCQLLTTLGVKHLSGKTPSKISLMRQIKKTRRMLKDLGSGSNTTKSNSSNNNDTVLLLSSLSPMTNEMKIAAMRIFTKTKSNAFYAKDKRIQAMLYCRCLQYTLVHGICKYSAAAFVDYGTVCASLFQNPGDGYRYGKVGLAIMEKLPKEDQKQVMAKINVGFYFHLCHWREPLHSSLEPLLRGHRYGLKEGDITNGLVCFGTYAMAYFVSGLELSHVAADMEKAITLMLEYRQGTIANVFRPLWQLLMCLMGETDDPLKLTGKAMDQDELMEQNIQDGNTAGARTILLCKLQLGHILRDYKLTKKILAEIHAYKAEMQPHFGFCREVFIEGMTCFALAKRRNIGGARAKYRRRGRLCMERVRKWTKKGAVNCHHLLLIMEAEMATLQERQSPDEIREKFDKAIASSARSGFSQNEAVASECAALHFFQDAERRKKRYRDPMYNPAEWAHSYLFRSYERYIEWGAKAKVGIMEVLYPNLVESRLMGSTESMSGDSYGSGQFRARSRFSRRMTEKHKVLAFF